MHAHAASAQSHAGRTPASAATSPLPGQAAAQSARLLTMGAAGGDFLAMLKQVEETRTPPVDLRGGSDPERDRKEETERPEEPASEAPQATAVEADLAERRTKAAFGTAVASAAKAAPSGGTPPPMPAAQPQADPADMAVPKGLTATVETAALDSRPRAALASGTSSVALAAQTATQAAAQQPAAGAQAQAAAQQPHAAETATEGLQQPGKTATAGADAPAARGGSGREAVASATNTTLAGLEQMAQKAQAQAQTQAQAQAQAQASAQPQAQAQMQTGGPNQIAGQAGLAQAAQLPSQAAEPAQTAQRLAVQASAATKPGAFAQALSGIEAPAGTTAAAPAAKTETAQAIKTTAATGRSAAPAADQVAVQIQKGAAAGQDRIQIKLNPAELGRVDVKLEFQADGGVRALVSVERAETFDLLQRDARSLERALADAGFRGQTSLSFEMQNGGTGSQFAGGERGDGGDRAPSAGDRPAAAPEPSAPETVQSAEGRATASAGSVDLRI